ncbi:MAG TPA: nuclear transport factor 2 family protein [Sphingomicrobium sp.]|nr:nuclear transport factor 2 family protein [Sphingomicrobium sp.]
MRKIIRLATILAAIGMAGSGAATVVPPTPGQIAIMKTREALENRARTEFGDIGLIEKLRDWRRTWGFILIGDEGARRAPRLLIKDEYGWYEMRPGQTRRLPLALSMELTRLLLKPDLWAEDPYHPGAVCTGAPRLFVISHAGQDRFGRLGCGRQGLAARVARTANDLRVQTGPKEPTATARQRPEPIQGASPAYLEASRQTTALLFEMAAAWERKTLAGFVEPYAPDVILEGPFGTYQGRKMVVDWARGLQDWTAPYAPGDRRIRVERIVSKNQPATRAFYTTHELRWEEDGKPVRQTFSTMWRNYDGQWLIAHERIGEVKPVTGRVPW